MKKLIIFDLDGTLLDTLGDLTQSVNHALRQCGLEVSHSRETIRTYVGNGIDKLLERSLPASHRTASHLQHMRGHFLPYYDQHSAELTQPYPGVPAMLAQLQQQGYLLAIASNKYQEATERLVRHYFPGIRFASVYGQRHDVPIKPHPQVVLDILHDTRTHATEALYVGDSGVDMQTALNARVDAIGVTWGFRTSEELASHHALALVDEATQLLAICQEMQA